MFTANNIVYVMIDCMLGKDEARYKAYWRAVQLVASVISIVRHRITRIIGYVRLAYPLIVFHSRINYFIPHSLLLYYFSVTLFSQ